MYGGADETRAGACTSWSGGRSCGQAPPARCAEGPTGPQQDRRQQKN
jgi:hypothetical protein